VRFKYIVNQPPNPMIANKARIAYKQLLLILCFVSFFQFFVNTCSAQVTDPQDQPIDPNQLKNLSPSALQNYLKDKNQNQSQPGEDIHRKNPLLKNESKVVKDSTVKEDIKKKANSAEDVYGNNLFQNSAIMELSELSTPPLDYPIGVGDHIVVALWGGADFETDYIVARDGTIFPQGLGKITVQGLTFDNARSIIVDRFRRVIPPSTNISVTIGQPRSIVVNVSGEVNNPGPVVVSAFTNALNVIALAGGLNEYGNLRNIQIKRNNRIIDSVDIYRYLTRGDFGSHLYMENGDFVIVPVYDKKVLASGQFKRPMYYQLKGNEGFRDLLKYTGGLTPDAYASGGVIIRNVNEKQTIKNVNFNAIGLKAGDKTVDEPLYNGDIVVVSPINPGLTNKVIVKGEVVYPNIYEIRKGDRLFDVLNRAGGITPNAYTERAYVYKGAGDSANLKSDKIEISLTELNKNNNSIYNIQIDPNDVIEVFNRNQFTEKQFVTIEGEVRKPGQVQKYGGMTLKDLLYLANGLKPTAEFGRVEISSIVDIDSAQKGLKPTQTIMRTYNVLPNLELDTAADNIKLKPYDQVYVRKNPTFELQQNISLEGEVKYPGNYPRLNKHETLSSFITRAGGLKENANLSGAILYRKKDIGIRQDMFTKIQNIKYIKDTSGKIVDSVTYNPAEPVSIDLYRALKYKNSKYDLVLQDSDIVYVPEINPLVNVKGAVQSSLKLYFDKEHTNLTYYIDKAGGYGIRPWRKRIYITYANGTSRRTKNFAFFHFFPPVEEGSTIIVPIKPEGKVVGDFIQQAATTVIPAVLTYLLIKSLQ
jgi:protein involved in polysaccharide export with SLBB domain